MSMHRGGPSPSPFPPPLQPSTPPARAEVRGLLLDLQDVEVDALVRADLRAQLAADALVPVDRVLAAVRLRELDPLVRVQDRDGLPPERRDDRLLHRHEERADASPQGADLAAVSGPGGPQRCTLPSACPSVGPPARSRAGPSSSGPPPSSPP